MTFKKFVPVITATTFTGLLLGIPVMVAAWNTSQSANAICLANGTGAIHFSFTNTESDTPMNVIAKDSQTGVNINLGTIQAHQTKSGEIDTNKNSLDDGKITFALTWTNKPGSDSRTANYNSVKCVSSTPTPTPTPFPTATPTPYPTATPTPTVVPSATPTPMPSVTPTVIPSATPTPMPSVTPTVIPSDTPTPMPSVTPAAVTTDTNNNNNDNSNNNSNANNQNQNVNVSQNVTQQTGNINVTVQAANATNTNTITNTNTTVQPITNAKQLPSTGVPFEAGYGLLTLLPLGLKLRKFAQK